MHRPGQVIPGGLLDTDPRPCTATVSETNAGANVADACFGASMVTVHAAPPVQAPPQRRKRDPSAAVARRTTSLPCSPGRFLRTKTSPGRPSSRNW